MEQILDILCLNKFPRNVTNDIIFMTMPTKLLKHPRRSYIALPKNSYILQKIVNALSKMYHPR